MLTLVLIGLLGGLITGISPCILPLLPVIFFSGGAASARTDSAGTTAPPPSRWRPYQVVAGLVLSFSLVTLAGSLLLNALGLPQDVLRILGIVILVLVGLGMIVPRLEEILEKPFSWIPQRHVSSQRGGFVLGLALGAVYVPCAGPVLAAITVAGATGRIGLETAALTVSFAVGAAIPLLAFALAGRGLAERLKAFRRRQKGIRVTGGVLLIVLAVGLVLDVPARLQRALPNYTHGLEQAFNSSDEVRQGLGNAAPSGSAALASCPERAPALTDCGPVPALTPSGETFNTSTTPTRENLKGKVVLVDFWTYSCINCQRSIPHLNEWYAKYKKAGLEIVGVHSPEFAFEHDSANVRAGIERLGVKYPVFQDNDFTTWDAFSNRYWPAHYLVDAQGRVRHVAFGEGGYDLTEKLIRELLVQANPGVELPAADSSVSDAGVARGTTPETYLGASRQSMYSGEGDYMTRTFPASRAVKQNSFTLSGDWTVTGESIEAGKNARLLLGYTAKKVHLVVSGEGTLEVSGPGGTKRIEVHGAPNAQTLIDGAESSQGVLSVTPSPGLKLFAFTYG